jgi:hypothetical protein
MLDRVLNSALWMIVMGLIAGTAAGSLLMASAAVMALCTNHYPDGGVKLLVAVALAAFSYVLCHHANDLMDR